MMTPTMDAAAPEPRLVQVLRMGPSPSQIGLVFSLAAGLTLAAAALMWAMRPTMVPLYTSLRDHDPAEVARQLTTMRVPFEVQPETGLILVSSEEVARLRMSLGAEGLGDARGGAMADLVNQPYNVGSFIEQRMYYHKLEQEIARTIEQTRGVDAARVHLAIPKQTSFIRDRIRPAASVHLKLRSGTLLDAAQIQGIANLVASSVPNLELARVKVVDHNGRLLTRDETDGLSVSSRQLEYKLLYERGLIAKIEELLFPAVGMERMRAQVNADMDFAVEEKREVVYAGSDDKVRSEQIEEQRNDGAGAEGVPGALTNQPPEGGTLGGPGEAGGEGAAGSFRKSVTRNKELDKSETQIRKRPGRLLRLSVAVVIDDRISAGEEGQIVRTPREQAELDAYTELVKEAVGFDAERGDTVKVINRSFEPPMEFEAPVPPPVWEQPWFATLVKYALTALVLLLLALMVLRPAVKKLTHRPAPREADGAEERDDVADDTLMLESDRLSLTSDASDMLPAPPRVYGDILNLAREMAADDPKRVATVLRKWLETDAAE